MATIEEISLDLHKEGIFGHVPIPEDQMNRDVIQPLLETTWRYWVIVIPLAIVTLVGLSAWGYMMATGMYTTGLERPGMWGVFIANFVFWIGLSHSGTLISAILRLAKADWRRPVTRLAEAMTLFTILIAAQWPLIHLGRTWFFYYLLPYPNQRTIWSNLRSPLLFDMFAIMTYLTGSSLYLFMPLIPDLAIARDYCTGMRKKVYGVLCLGWRGTHQQWYSMEKAMNILAGLILPVAVSVHTIVSWDFAATMNAAWHTTIFGPYFVLGAIYSGMALVVTVFIALRWAFRLEAYLTLEHLDKLAKIILVAAIIWTYLWFNDYFVTWYAHWPYEWFTQASKDTGPFWYLEWYMLGINTFVTIPCFLFKKLRMSTSFMLVWSLLLNLGMWLERFLIVVPTLSHPQFTAAWRPYTMSPVELMIAAGAMTAFPLLYMIFVKLVPIIPASECKEDKIVASAKRIGLRYFPTVAKLEG